MIHRFVSLFLHLDQVLGRAIETYDVWIYVLLFLVIFCETGLILLPLLPGDSLLFAAGAFSASGKLSAALLFFLLSGAAILGDMVNYRIGSLLGPKVFSGTNRWLKKSHLEKTQMFYERHGAKTIVIARFVPIVRTFAPFVAGIGRMNYWRFSSYNVAGGILWTGTCLSAGYFFGNIPAVKNNFSLVLLGIIGVSLLPALIEFLRHRSEGRKNAGA